MLLGLQTLCQMDWHGCNTHRIQLGVKKALDRAPGSIKVLLEKVKNMCVKIMGSPRLCGYFKEIQEHLYNSGHYPLPISEDPASEPSVFFREPGKFNVLQIDH